MIQSIQCHLLTRKKINCKKQFWSSMFIGIYIHSANLNHVYKTFSLTSSQSSWRGSLSRRHNQSLKSSCLWRELYRLITRKVVNNTVRSMFRMRPRPVSPAGRKDQSVDPAGKSVYTMDSVKT